jgi:hypothetical protein
MLRLTVLHNITDSRSLPELNERGEFDPKGKFFGYDKRCQLQLAYSLNWGNWETDTEAVEQLFAWDNMGNRLVGCRCRSLSVGDVVQVWRLGAGAELRLSGCYACENVGWKTVDSDDVTSSLIDGVVLGGVRN